MNQPKPSKSSRHADAPEAPARYEEAVERFIVFWGEMGSNWGINRTMAQIHALLYCSEEPLDTDAIMERLQISRGNANMNLRALVDWSLAHKVSRPGSRKDFFSAEKDVWTITAQIIKERQRREITPVKEQLHACRDVLIEGRGEAEDCDDLPEREQVLCRRFENLMALMEVFEGFSGTLLPFVQAQNAGAVQKMMEMVRRMRPEEQ